MLQRKALNTFFAQARKVGWLVYLISQNGSQLDKQVGALHERHIHLKNARKLASWWNPLRWLRIDLFVAVTVWGGDRQGTRLGTEVFTLNKRTAALYDTMDMHEPDIAASDVIVLSPAKLEFASSGQRAESSQAAAADADDQEQSEHEEQAA